MAVLLGVVAYVIHDSRFRYEGYERKQRELLEFWLISHLVFLVGLVVVVWGLLLLLHLRLEALGTFHTRAPAPHASPLPGIPRRLTAA
jgi:putative flippase GtrA